MKKIAPILNEAFLLRMRERNVPPDQRGDFLKWLRFYLDFCVKYNHAPRDPDSLAPFLRKLTQKRQPPALQQQAADSVSLYYEVIRDWKTEGPSVVREAAGSETYLRGAQQNHADGAEPGPPGGMPGPVRTEPGPSATDVVVEAPSAWDACYRNLKEEIRLRQYSPRTLQTYSGWTRQFELFLKHKPPSEITSEDAKRFLSHLATDKQVAASTQNQAFNALLFLFRHILKADYNLYDTVTRARKTTHIPVVLSRKEVDQVVRKLSHPYNLAVQLLYGCGLRLFECLNLRVQCLNFDEAILTVHDGKGKKDRTVPLPRSLLPALRDHFKKVENLYALDLKAAYDGVFMPGALDRKWKSAAKDFGWQWFFPARTLTLIPEKGERRRWHMHESELQKALRRAVRGAKIAKRVTCHTFRHSFASHLLRANYDIRSIQQLLGHSDLRTTMIYTHTVESRTLKELTSPLDFLPDQIKMTEQGR